MKNILTALAIAWLMSTAACHKDNKAAQLAALDKAYQSGVFSKEEYDAKKQALMGTAAPPAPAGGAAAAAAAGAAGGTAPDASSPLANPPMDAGQAAGAPAAADVPAATPALPDASQQPMAMPPPAPAQAAPAPAAPKPPRSSQPRVAPAAPPAPAGAMAQPPAPWGAASQPPMPAGAMGQQPPMQAPPAQGQYPPQGQAPPQAQYPPQQPQYQAPPQPQYQAPPATGGAVQEPEPAPLPGCEDAESRAGGPKGVMERFFPASEDAVRRAANTALSTLDFQIHRNDQHEIEASKRGHLNAVVGAGVEHMILRFASVQRNGQRGTLVTGETKKTLVGRLTQKSWTSAVMAQISCNLRSGR